MWRFFATLIFCAYLGSAQITTTTTSTTPTATTEKSLCPEGFTGSQCKTTVYSCEDTPKSKKANYTKDADDINSSFQCKEGSTFSEGSTMIQLICLNDQWTLVNETQKVPFVCSPMCELNGKKYITGEVVQQSCNNCTCGSNGQFNCTNICPKTCELQGDPHVKTFDGLTYTYMGKGSYHFVKVNDIIGQEIDLIAHTTACVYQKSDASCLTGFTLNAKYFGQSTSVVFRKDSIASLVVNGEELSLPFTLLGGRLYLRREDKNIVSATFSDGFKLTWLAAGLYGCRGTVSAPDSYAGRTSGLCGTLDGDKSNDLTTADGVIESSATTSANTWCVEGTCDESTVFDPPSDMCALYPERRQKAEEACSYLKSDTFADCLADVTGYHDSCMFDLCKADSDEKFNAFRDSAYTAYADECTSTNGGKLYINVTCPTGQVYEACSKWSYRSCSDFLSPYAQNFSTSCRASCRCPELRAFVSDSSDQCVPVEDCKVCTYNDVQYQIGSQMQQDGYTCTCNNNGQWDCTKIVTTTTTTSAPSTVASTTTSDVCTSTPNLLNAALYCTPQQHCTYTCKDGYTFENGDTSAKMICSDGQWIWPNNNSSVKACQPICSPPCENNGYCSRPNECYCEPDFTGSRCESDVVALCQSWGDPHFKTFDHSFFEFMGQCSYHLLKVDDFLDVILKNINCNSYGDSYQYSCLDQLTINANQSGESVSILLRNDLRHSIEINGDDKTNNLPLNLLENTMNVRKASEKQISVLFADNLLIEWDGYTVSIYAPSSYKGHTSGLCGPYDGDKSNDLQTPDGTVAESASAFGNSWRVREICDESTFVDDTPHPCELNAERKQRAETSCAYLNSDIFPNCSHSHMYYDSCLYDLCLASEQSYKTLMETSYATYAKQCSRNRTIINWRPKVPGTEVECPAGQVYEECSEACYRSCADISTTRQNCGRSCVAGCRCPVGQALNDDNQCTPIENCPCKYNDVTYNSGYIGLRHEANGLNLCECKAASWECDEATESNETNFNPFNYWLAYWSSQCSRGNVDSPLCKINEPEFCQLYPERCACDYDGKKYGDGNYLNKGCSTCFCMSGNWLCSASECEDGIKFENGTNIGVNNLTQTIQCQGGDQALGQITLPNTCTIVQNEGYMFENTTNSATNNSTDNNSTNNSTENPEKESENEHRSIFDIINGWLNGWHRHK